MTNHSKRNFTLGLLAAAGLSVAHAVSAEKTDPGAADATRAHEHHRKHWAERRAKRMEALKKELELNAGQEDAWGRYTQALSEPHDDRSTGDRGNFRDLTTPERLDRALERQTLRQQRFKQRADATREFYAQLTPEQQAIFDDKAMRRPHRGRHHGRRGRQRHRG